jgi:hypothetical protein
MTVRYNCIKLLNLKTSSRAALFKGGALKIILGEYSKLRGILVQDSIINRLGSNTQPRLWSQA